MEIIHITIWVGISFNGDNRLECFWRFFMAFFVSVNEIYFDFENEKINKVENYLKNVAKIIHKQFLDHVVIKELFLHPEIKYLLL